MFEEQVTKISKKIFGNEEKSEYSILSNKKNGREMYFRKGSKQGIAFAKQKFNTRKKRIIHLLLRLEILQKFSKKIYLSSKMGDVIFVAGQIKGFDIKKGEVYSFVRIPSKSYLKIAKDYFLKSKFAQKKASKTGFAPKIEINAKKVFSKEKLYDPYNGTTKEIFENLSEYHKKVGLKKESYKKMCDETIKSLKKAKINENKFISILKKISRKRKRFLTTKIHGEFGREQCIGDGEKVLFVDWNSRNGLLTEDFVNFFREEESFLENPKFMESIKILPIEVQKNIKDYLIVSVINVLSKTNFDQKNFDLAKKRISNLLSFNNPKAN